MVIFGGRTGVFSMSNKVIEFDFEKEEWRQVKDCENEL